MVMATTATDGYIQVVSACGIRTATEDAPYTKVQYTSFLV